MGLAEGGLHATVVRATILLKLSTGTEPGLLLLVSTGLDF